MLCSRPPALRPAEVISAAGVHLDDLAVLDERGHLDPGPALAKGVLRLGGGGGALQLGGSVHDLQLDRGGKLGLAGMLERTQLLDGTLKVQPTPGKGTILTIEIPTSNHS